MRAHQYDDLTVERWRIEPRLHPLDVVDEEERDQAPPLWKDLLLACLMAMLLWAVAAMLFG